MQEMFPLRRNFRYWFWFGLILWFGLWFRRVFDLLFLWLILRLRLRLRLRVVMSAGLQYLDSLQEECICQPTFLLFDFQFGESITQLLVRDSEFESFHARLLQERYTGCVGTPNRLPSECTLL